MARTPLTAAQRAANVAVAIASLPRLSADAIAAQATHGANSPQARTAWEAVETAGAIVHRQSRLLAGKSKGG